MVTASACCSWWAGMRWTKCSCSMKARATIRSW
jgi:hypothetical protein